MDFNDTTEEAAFRAAARHWLSDNYPCAEELQGLSSIECSRLWQKRKYDAGWACLSWPPEHGGRGASAIEQVIWDEEEANVNSIHNPFTIGQGMAAPTLMTWATKEQCQRYLPKIASGEELWCQLFSEPVSGSDLAGLKSKAERDGDHWIINGQKVWTSFARHARYAVLLVRTDPSVVKHAGLTYFFIDMHSPGVEVKPIKQISGATHFNEVFLSDVRIPDSQRLGAPGQGWEVALTTLMNERYIAGGGNKNCDFAALFKLAGKLSLNDKVALKDGQVRGRLADWYCQEKGLRFTMYRAMTALSKGETPGAENSIGKLVVAPLTQDMAAFALDLIESSSAMPTSPTAKTMGIFQKGTFQDVFLEAPGNRIAGGTDEILLNIIAERVLGMPPSIRADKGVPFSEVPTSN